MPLTIDKMDEALKAIHKHYGELKYEDLMTDVQDYIFADRALKKEKMQFEGGTEIERNLVLDHQDSARWTGLYETDDISVKDKFDKGEVRMASHHRELRFRAARDGDVAGEQEDHRLVQDPPRRLQDRAAEQVRESLVGEAVH
jgi:hypothetical protein